MYKKKLLMVIALLIIVIPVVMALSYSRITELRIIGNGYINDSAICTAATGCGAAGDTNETIRIENAITNGCPTGQFPQNFSSTFIPQCAAAAGSGDITAVYTNETTCIFGDTASGDAFLQINDTCLNNRLSFSSSGYDGNASSICDGLDVYLNGEGSCINLTKVFTNDTDTNTQLTGAQVINYVGNWSLDKVSYPTETEVNNTRYFPSNSNVSCLNTDCTQNITVTGGMTYW